MTVEWQGVFPAATTQFASDAAVDLEATTAHLERLIRAGVHGLVMLGTVGENCSLSAEAKRSVVEAAVKTAAGRVPVIAGVAETPTRAACNYAADVEALGADGVMEIGSGAVRDSVCESVYDSVVEGVDNKNNY